MRLLAAGDALMVAPAGSTAHVRGTVFWRGRGEVEEASGGGGGGSSYPVRHGAAGVDRERGGGAGMAKGLAEGGHPAGVGRGDHGLAVGTCDPGMEGGGEGTVTHLTGATWNKDNTRWC